MRVNINILMLINTDKHLEAIHNSFTKAEIIPQSIDYQRDICK